MSKYQKVEDIEQRSIVPIGNKILPSTINIETKFYRIIKTNFLKFLQLLLKRTFTIIRKNCHRFRYETTKGTMEL